LYYYIFEHPSTQSRLVAERIRRRPGNQTIAGLIPVYSHFATPFSKEFNLAMLTVAAIGPPRWSGKN